MGENGKTGAGAGNSRLQKLMEAAKFAGEAPVEQWNPPYCGDIGLAIGADGIWTYGGSPIRRDALVKLFARVLRKDADGRTYLVTPAEKVDVRVEDAPFLAVEMEVSGEGADRRLLFRTNVGDVATCDCDHPMRFEVEAGSAGLKPYVLVRGRLEALVTRSLTYDLLELAEEDGGGRIGIWSGGAFFPLPAEG